MAQVKRNAKLLRQVADYIEASPKKYDQTIFFARKTADDDAAYVGDILDNKMHCKSVGCVAGWTVALSMKRATAEQKELSVSEAAQEKLGLTTDERYWLFDGERLEEAMPSVLRLLATGADIEQAQNLEEMIYEVGVPDFRKIFKPKVKALHS